MKVTKRAIDALTYDQDSGGTYIFEAYLSWRGYAEQMSALDSRLAAVSRDPATPPAARRQIGAGRAAARRALDDSDSLLDLRDAHRFLQPAALEAVRIESDRMVERLQAALDEVEKRTGLQEIEAATSELDPGDPPAVKRRRVLEMLGLWHQRVQIVPDEESRAGLERLIATIRDRYETGDKEGAAAGLGELHERWVEFQDGEDAAAQSGVLVPYCTAWASRLQAELAAAREQAAVFGDDPEVAAADRELESVRQSLATVTWDATCHETLLEIEGRLLDLGNRLFATQIRRAPASRAILEAAETSEVAAAVAEARRLLRRVRPLDVIVRTPAKERVSGRRIAIELRGLGPLWGAGTEVVLDFGDGSPPWQGDAERAREKTVFEHRFERPGGYRLQARAVQELGPDATAAEDRLLGEGVASIDVLPDPISGVRRLASLFFNLQFLLALAVGLLIQAWRLYGDKPFGAARRDYLEAFALGVAARASVDGLATLLPELLR